MFYVAVHHEEARTLRNWNVTGIQLVASNREDPMG